MLQYSPFFLKVIDEDYSICIQKTLSITFPANCCVFGRFSALSPGLTHCFDPSRASGVLWWIYASSIDTNRHNDSFGLRLKQAKFCFEVVTRMRFWSIVGNRGAHFAQSFLMHKCVCKILNTRSVEIPAEKNRQNPIKPCQNISFYLGVDEVVHRSCKWVLSKVLSGPKKGSKGF